MLELQHCNCSKCCYASRDHPTRNTLPPHRIETPAQSLLWLYSDKYVQYPLFATPGPRAHTKNTWISPRAYVHVLIYCTTKKDGVSWSESWYFTAYSFPEHGMITRKFKRLCLSPYPISHQHFWVPSLNRTVGIALVEFPVRAASHRIQPSGVMFCFTEEASGWTMERHTQKSP